MFLKLSILFVSISLIGFTLTQNNCYISQEKFLFGVWSDCDTYIISGSISKSGSCIPSYFTSGSDIFYCNNDEPDSIKQISYTDSQCTDQSSVYRLDVDNCYSSQYNYETSSNLTILPKDSFIQVNYDVGCGGQPSLDDISSLVYTYSYCNFDDFVELSTITTCNSTHSIVETYDNKQCSGSPNSTLATPIPASTCTSSQSVAFICTN